MEFIYLFILFFFTDRVYVRYVNMRKQQHCIIISLSLSLSLSRWLSRQDIGAALVNSRLARVHRFESCGYQLTSRDQENWAFPIQSQPLIYQISKNWYLDVKPAVVSRFLGEREIEREKKNGVEERSTDTSET